MWEKEKDEVEVEDEEENNGLKEESRRVSRRHDPNPNTESGIDRAENP